MSYKPSFWETQGKPFALTLFLIIAGASVLGLAIGGINAGCSYQGKADALAEKIRVDTSNTELCRSSIIARKDHDSLDVKCDHPNHVLRTEWERGKLTVQCLCPNTIADEKSRSNSTEEDSTSEEKIEEKIEEKTENEEI